MPRNFAIAYERDPEALLGHPEPLVFATYRDARIRRDKIAHQTQGGSSLIIVPTDMPVNCGPQTNGARKP